MTGIDIDQIRGGLIVSCQSGSDSPLSGPDMMARFALAGVQAGAVGIRTNGPVDVAAIRAVTRVPIIGLHKVMGPARRMITPTVQQAQGLVNAGADVVAVEATAEVRAYGADPFDAFVAATPSVMADVSTLVEGIEAWERGATVVGTTLSGYTPESRSDSDDPDIRLVAQLAARGIPVIAEGRYRTTAQVRAAFDAGALAVVVGGAITDPLATAIRFASATPRGAA